MSTVGVNMLERVVDTLSACLTPESARRILEMRVDPAVAARARLYAEKANEGRLNPEEDAEYREYLDAMDLIAVLQAEARRVLESDRGA